MLCWGAFSEWGKECVAFSFAYKCGQYVIYESLPTIATQIAQDARIKIVDAPLMPIFRMWQELRLPFFWW